MGQRSQIYVMVDGKLEVANYYQWNYGDRMISRARYGIEWIKGYIDYPSSMQRSGYNFEKFRRIWDVNFDYKDIMMSTDIFKEYEDFKDDTTFNEYAIHWQENNDGKLFVMVDTKEKSIRFTLTDYDLNVLTPIEYMDWDYSDWRTSKYLDDEMRQACINNIKWLEENAVQMTDDDLAEFIKEVDVC